MEGRTAHKVLVSMVDGELFDKFCKIGQKLRKNERPFGGIQIIVTGDFFQLPPVTKGGGVPRFCFEAMTWDESINMSVNLTKVFRQKDQRELARTSLAFRAAAHSAQDSSTC